MAGGIGFSDWLGLLVEYGKRLLCLGCKPNPGRIPLYGCPLAIHVEMTHDAGKVGVILAHRIKLRRAETGLKITKRLLPRLRVRVLGSVIRNVYVIEPLAYRLGRTNCPLSSRVGHDLEVIPYRLVVM